MPPYISLIVFACHVPVLIVPSVVIAVVVDQPMSVPSDRRIYPSSPIAILAHVRVLLPIIKSPLAMSSSVVSECVAERRLCGWPTAVSAQTGTPDEMTKT